MNNFTSHTQLELAQAIWRTLAYVDLFDYPLTAVEIHRYLESVPASLDEVMHAIRHSPLLAGQLVCRDGFYSLPGREAVFAMRQQRQQQAVGLWAAARRYGALIARLPFVRAIVVGAQVFPPQCARLHPARLERCGADPARDPQRGSGDRCFDHAHDAGARRGAGIGCA